MRRSKYIDIGVIDDLYFVLSVRGEDFFEDLAEARDHARTLSIQKGLEVRDRLVDHTANPNDDKRGLFTAYIGDQEIWMAYGSAGYRCYLTPFDALWS